MSACRPCVRLLAHSLSKRPSVHRTQAYRPLSRRQDRCIASTHCVRASRAAEEKSPAEDGPHSSTPKFTSEAYPDIKRDSRFARLTEEHLEHFKSIVGDSPSALIEGLTQDASSDLDPYNADWMHKYRGHGQLVLRPDSTEQVSQILKYCNDQKLAVVPQGGNTGLVGGSVPVFDEIVLGLGRMSKIHEFDEVSDILVADAGVILEVADNYLAERKHIFPLDLGAKGSCQIGGTVATNAGGLRLLRYGSMHGNVLGIEAVLPDGTIVDDLCTLRKNNTGYDLKQLFIGGEGTIGVITKISILCPQRSSAVNVAAFGLESFEKCQEAFREAKGRLGEIISAFEFMDAASQKALKTAKGSALPLEGEYPFYCLLETSGSNPEHDQEKLEAFLSHVMENSIVADGVLAQDATQATNLWSCREGIPEALGHWGGVYKYDLSLPLPSLYALVTTVREHLVSLDLIGDDASGKPVVDVVGYGHLGDSNLHLNVPTRRFDKIVEKALEPFVFEKVKEARGSISAEHGLGLAKAPFIRYSRSENMVGLMRRIKGLFDPNGIMNPYKYV